MNESNAGGGGKVTLPEVEHPPKPVRFVEHGGLDDLNHRSSEAGPADASKEGEPDAKDAPQAPEGAGHEGGGAP